MRNADPDPGGKIECRSEALLTTNEKSSFLAILSHPVPCAVHLLWNRSDLIRIPLLVALPFLRTDLIWAAGLSAALPRSSDTLLQLPLLRIALGTAGLPADLPRSSNILSQFPVLRIALVTAGLPADLPRSSNILSQLPLLRIALVTAGLSADLPRSSDTLLQLPLLRIALVTAGLPAALPRSSDTLLQLPLLRIVLSECLGCLQPCHEAVTSCHSSLCLGLPWVTAGLPADLPRSSNTLLPVPTFYQDWPDWDARLPAALPRNTFLQLPLLRIALVTAGLRAYLPRSTKLTSVVDPDPVKYERADK